MTYQYPEAGKIPISPKDYLAIDLFTVSPTSVFPAESFSNKMPRAPEPIHLFSLLFNAVVAYQKGDNELAESLVSKYGTARENLPSGLSAIVDQRFGNRIGIALDSIAPYQNKSSSSE